MDGSSRSRPRAAAQCSRSGCLRVEAGPERRLGNLELGLAGLARGEPARSSVPAVPAPVPNAALVAAHPAEDLDRGTEAPRAIRRGARRSGGGPARARPRRLRAPSPTSAARRGGSTALGSLAARSPVSYVPIETCSRRGTRSAPGGGADATARATRSGPLPRGEGEERRARLAPVVPATSAAATAGRSGMRASGNARFTTGMTAKASTSRSGPLTNGTDIRPPSLGFGPEAVFRPVRVGRRHHEVGPCTSTPF